MHFREEDLAQPGLGGSWRAEITPPSCSPTSSSCWMQDSQKEGGRTHSGSSSSSLWLHGQSSEGHRDELGVVTNLEAGGWSQRHLGTTVPAVMVIHVVILTWTRKVPFYPHHCL